MKRKILIALFTGIFLLGVYGMLNRDNPTDKYIGNVYVKYAENKAELSGDVLKRVYNDKTYDYDEPDIKENAESMCIISRQLDQPDENSEMSRAFVGDKMSASYDVYDENFDVISENDNALKIQGKEDTVYYVSLDVKWGKEKENVLVRYFFAVKFE